MNREETLAIMGVLKAAYPNYYKDMKKSEAEGIEPVWASEIEPYPIAVTKERFN